MSFSTRVISEPPPPATRAIRVITAALWALPVAISVAAMVAIPSKTGTAVAGLFKGKPEIKEHILVAASMVIAEEALLEPETFRRTAAMPRYRTVFDMRLRNEKNFPMQMAYLPQPTVRAAHPVQQRVAKATMKAAPVMQTAGLPGVSREPVASIASVKPNLASAPLVETRIFTDVRVAAANALSADGMTIVLAGINPPKQGTKCRRIDGALLDCIERAEARLAILLTDRRIKCKISKPVSEGFVAGSCMAGKISIASDLLKQGLANQATAAVAQTQL